MSRRRGGAALAGWATVARHPGEPLDAWEAALLATGVDPGRIDSLDVVYCQSWAYDDPPRRLADRVGASPRRLAYSGIGGTTPLALLTAAATRVASGEADVCAVVGGEALATVRRLKRAGERPAWSHRAAEKRPFPFEAPFHPAEVAHSVFQAYTTFALRDVARRAHAGLGVDEHRASLGELFAPLTEVAAANPHAWSPQRRTAEELVAPTDDNRMVAHPYTKRLVAQMDVDQAFAVVVAADGPVWLRRSASAEDPVYVAEHDELWRSPAMAAVLPPLAAHDHVDLYSCFPSAVAFALDAAGPAPSLTVTGGLPYFGGAGSCYALGSTAAMADRLAAGDGSTGVLTAVGMHLSKHASLTLSTAHGPFEVADVAVAEARRPIVERHDGAATVAAYTVHHGRDGAPTDALLVCDVDGGARCYAAAGDPGLLAALEAEEWVGRQVRLRSDGDVNRAAAA